MPRIAMLSVHSSPLATLGGKETGGMNVYIRELSKELATKGFHIDIFTRSQGASTPQITTCHKGVRIVHLKAGPEIPYDKSKVWFYLPEFLEGVQQFSQQENLRYHLIHSHYWLSGWVGTKLSTHWNVPLLHMFHTLGHFKNKAIEPFGESEPAVRLEVETQLIKHAHHLVVASPREKVQMIWSYGIPSEKISVIPCGVDSQLFIPHESFPSKTHLGLPPKRFILFVGRIDPVKGIDTLLKAMALVKSKSELHQEVHLLIIGGEVDTTSSSHDREMHRLQRLTSKLGLKNMVTFMGAQPQHQLPYFYSAAEVCVLPSRYESFGMVALEAMACGTPVIASKVGGLTSFIQDEVNGFLVPEGDEKSLAEKIITLLTNASLKETLGLLARRKTEAFSWSHIAYQMTTLYHFLLKKKGDDTEEIVTIPFPLPERQHALLTP